jgi:hypothetical protein
MTCSHCHRVHALMCTVVIGKRRIIVCAPCWLMASEKVAL